LLLPLLMRKKGTPETRSLQGQGQVQRWTAQLSTCLEQGFTAHDYRQSILHKAGTPSLG
jgi:hypothetical protein